MSNQKYFWLRVTTDEYELPLEVADTAQELAQICGVKVETVRQCVSRRERHGDRTRYARVPREDHTPGVID